MGHLGIMWNEIDSTMRQRMDEIQHDYRVANEAGDRSYRFVLGLLRAFGALLTR